MAIVREFFSTRTDGVNLYRTYSDAGMMLLQNETGIEYSDVVDIESAPYTYSESANPIENPIQVDIQELKKAVEILLGGEI